jgi:hypothetical protein
MLFFWLISAFFIYDFLVFYFYFLVLFLKKSGDRFGDAHEKKNGNPASYCLLSVHGFNSEFIVGSSQLSRKTFVCQCIIGNITHKTKSVKNIVNDLDTNYTVGHCSKL